MVEDLPAMFQHQGRNDWLVVLDDSEPRARRLICSFWLPDAPIYAISRSVTGRPNALSR